MSKPQEISENLKLILQEGCLEPGDHGVIFYDHLSKHSYIKFKDGRVFRTTDIAKDWLANNPKTSESQTYSPS